VRTAARFELLARGGKVLNSLREHLEFRRCICHGRFSSSLRRCDHRTFCFPSLLSQLLFQLDNALLAPGVVNFHRFERLLELYVCFS
jgi:hypothetical protein